jgi:N-acetylglucosaminyl-diphospho-decaprenol L-rhamnosyltransferase
MTDLSVLVPVRDRTDHLRGVVSALGRAAVGRECELLVGWMGGSDPRPALRGARGFATRVVEVDGEEMPLARTRNQLAMVASGSALVFLDVDCVPAAGLLTAYAKALAEHDALAIGETRYLPRGFRADGADERSLRRAARQHPERGELFPAPGEVRVGGSHELFWSLNFAVRRETFLALIGGFDEAYRGYGIEDTDFAMRAARAEVPLAWVGGALAFHQHHPPTRLLPEGVPALVGNVRRYRELWGAWPARGWLEELAAAGLIDWDEAAGTLAPRVSRASAIR